MFEKKLRSLGTQHVSTLETVLYAAVAVLLIVAASLGVIRAGATIWHGLILRENTSSELLALDHILLVLMLIEILHTVRISIRTQQLTVVPFYSPCLGHYDARGDNHRPRLPGDARTSRRIPSFDD
jgi:uncharacterized membrane protein (DUF373 family)